MLIYDSCIVLGDKYLETPESITLTNTLHISTKKPVHRLDDVYLPKTIWRGHIIPVSEGFHYSTSKLRTTYNKKDSEKISSKEKILKVLEEKNFKEISDIIRNDS